MKEPIRPPIAISKAAFIEKMTAKSAIMPPSMDIRGINCPKIGASRGCRSGIKSSTIIPKAKPPSRPEIKPAIAPLIGELPAKYPAIMPAKISPQSPVSIKPAMEPIMIAIVMLPFFSLTFSSFLTGSTGTSDDIVKKYYTVT